MLRPEQLKLDPGAGSLALGEARVEKVVFQGSHLRVSAQSAMPGVGELILRLPAHTPIGRGKSIRVFAEPDDVVVLNH